MLNRLNIGNKYYLRQEPEGLSLYDKRKHLFWYYEGESLEIFQSIENLNKNAITDNINTNKPFYLGWLITGKCNLDCIYCIADSKMHVSDNPDYMSTVKKIITLDPLCVGLTGGEPTLNPNLANVIEQLDTYGIPCALDTNGTTRHLSKLIPVLKKTKTLVRLTVDILSEDKLQYLRPRKNAMVQTEMIKQNLKLLIDNGISVVVHTVLTKINICDLDDTAKELIKLGVRRWHFYQVKCTKKCVDIYDQIKVTQEEVVNCCKNMINKYGKEIEISYPTKDLGNRDRAVLMIDCTGQLFVEDSQGNIIPIQNIDDVKDIMNYELHKKCYLCNLW